MSKLEFETFKDLLLGQLKTENNDYLSTIEKSKKLINEWFDRSDSTFVKNFIHDFNNTILDSEVKNYDVFENVLKLKTFTYVYAEFIKSDILVKACKMVNRRAVKWLLNFNISNDIQDEYGMTALMYAAKTASLTFALDKLINRSSNINMTDYYGNTALFHATSCPDNLKKLLKTKIDINHLNNDNESVLLYCCRYDKNRAYEMLANNKSLDPNLSNCVGKTAAMYLVENGRFKDIKTFIKKRKIDPSYVNKFGESLVSTYVKKFYQQYIGMIGETNYGSRYNYIVTKNLALTLVSLVELKCNFDIPVDEEGNTPIMVFLMIKDYVTAKYLLDKCKTINLSTKNKNGINASFLSTFIDREVFEKLEYNKTRNQFSISYKALKNAIQDHPTYDNSFDADITITPVFKNLYPIVPEIAKIAEQFILEVFYPNAGGVVTYGCNTYRVNSMAIGNHLADVRGFL